MAQYEYKVVPAPRKGVKTKDHKTPEARFSYALQEVMNEHGGDGWEYLRAETLPSDERSGLTGSQTVFRDVLVFRRARTVVEASVKLPPLEHMPEDTPAPHPAPDMKYQIARDSTDTDEHGAPHPAPPVRPEDENITDRSTAPSTASNADADSDAPTNRST